MPANRTGRRISRRSFLTGTGAALLGIPVLLRSGRGDASEVDPELFPLGVYSGDPGAHSVVIGTRLAPDPLNGGGLRRPVPVVFEVARDPGMVRIVRSGVRLARPENGHSLRVLVDGLPSDRWFWYRFRALGTTSRIGRTRTFPDRRDRADALRFALVSCQDFRTGFYAAYRDIAGRDLDCVVHVGDYIYEDGSSSGDLRMHTRGSGPDGEILTTVDYRNRYAQYRLDPDFRAALAAFPFIVTFDDHEVDNNYAGELAEVGAPAQDEAFGERRRAAYQVYAEVMPLRTREIDGGLRLARRLRFGRLADFHVLDTRQFRSDQPCNDGFQTACGGERDPAATLLGGAQERKLQRDLRRSRTTWNVLAQQVMMTRWDLRALADGDVELVNMDAWDGYVAARQRLTDFLAAERPANPVVLTGDIHCSFAADVLRDFSDPGTVVAAEIVGTSVSTPFIEDPALRTQIKRATFAANPHIRFMEGALRGYVHCELDRSRWIATYRGVVDVTRPDSPVIDVARARIDAGTPGFAAAPQILADPDGSPS